MALVAAIIAVAHFRSGSTLVDVHRYQGVQSWGGSWGLCLGDIWPKQTNGLFQFGESPVKAI